MLGGAAALVLLIVAVVLALTALPKWIAPDKEFARPRTSESSSRIERQNEVRSTAIQAIAGIVLAIGAVYTARSFRLSREAQLTEGLRSAVSQLHTGNVAAVGGVVALERLASDSPRDGHAILGLLATYIRMASPSSVRPPPPGSTRPKLAATMQEALDAIARTYPRQPQKRTLDLSDSALAGADLRGMFLPDVYLDGCDLASARLAGLIAPNAHLIGANLSSVDAIDARLRGATLNGATLTEAILAGSDLSDAKLRRAKLDKATFISAQLSRADFSRATGGRTLLARAGLSSAMLAAAELPGAIMDEADLVEAVLYRAQLPDASMQQANLTGADLRESDLKGADLRKARCAGASFNGADLRGAKLDGAVLEGTDLTDVKRDPHDPPLPIAGFAAAPQTPRPTSMAIKTHSRGPFGRLLGRLSVPQADPSEAYVQTLRRALQAWKSR
jgi:uncharacterized protein YjbI with pentapeptide repeats